MVQPSFQFTQSAFYSAAFNSAIFDGPIRIYFAQFQEESALKLYFLLRQHLEKEGLLPKALKSKDRNIFVLLYPNTEVFSMCFDGLDDEKDLYAIDHFHDSYVIGVPKPFQNDEEYTELISVIASLLRSLEFATPEAVFESTL